MLQTLEAAYKLYKLFFYKRLLRLDTWTPEQLTFKSYSLHIKMRAMGQKENCTEELKMIYTHLNRLTVLTGFFSLLPLLHFLENISRLTSISIV